jgi:hypothetical protein
MVKYDMSPSLPSAPAFSLHLVLLFVAPILVTHPREFSENGWLANMVVHSCVKGISLYAPQNALSSPL